MRRQRQKKTAQGVAEAPNLKLMAQLAVRVPGDLALRLRKFCQESGRSFNQTVAEALEQYLSRQKR